MSYTWMLSYIAILHRMHVKQMFNFGSEDQKSFLPDWLRPSALRPKPSGQKLGQGQRAQGLSQPRG